MPDPPPLKRRTPPPAAPSGAVPVRYAETHCRTNFSFLEGASHPDELVARAAELGYAALAVTDRNSLAGVVRAHVTAKEVQLKLLVGAEIFPVDAPPVILLATDRPAYGRLSHLITQGRCQAPKGECSLTFDELADHAAGLLALVPLAAPLTAQPDNDVLLRYRDVFGDRCYALAELHHGPQDMRLLKRMRQAAAQARVPLAAANDVHYHVRTRKPLQDVLTATRIGCTVVEAAAAGNLFPNSERHLKEIGELKELFAACPEALERTLEIAGRCRFSLDELRYEYPEELCPPGSTPQEHLTRLAWQGANDRYPTGIPEKVRSLIEHELELIADLRYEAYFLTVWDLVQFARSRDILCQGRGSAANSVVCFCLGVTSVDPAQIDVLFERFVSRERNEAPDIDVDFEHERREEVLQYVYDKYGRERAGMTAEVITYRPRSAVRDVGKALGLSLDAVDHMAKHIDVHGTSEQVEASCQAGGEASDKPDPRLAPLLLNLTRELLGFPRHLSQHVGGMVITQGLLSELVPIENAAMPGRTVIEWDKDDLDALGILKVDCLALGMLTAIHRAFDLIEQHTGRRLTLATVPAEDPAVYRMTWRADTMGVFQIESRAQMSMLPRLRPQCYYDLVIEVSIVRPGPIQGDMVHPYLRRRAGLEKEEYPSEAVRSVLSRTLGVPIFQEQAMRLAMVAAGFTPGEADQLRRAMGAWRRPGVMEQFERKLIAGMLANGYTEEFARRVFHQIRGFGEYGFPESHAASFALLVYVSAWMKLYYPAMFTAALLNSQPMGFYAPAQLVRDLREHGGEVRPVDVNFSQWDCTLEPIEIEETGMSFVSPRPKTPRTELPHAVPRFEGRPMDNPKPLDGRGPQAVPRAQPRTAPASAIPREALLEDRDGTSALPSPPVRDLQTVAQKTGTPLPRAWALRLGLRMVHGLARSFADAIVTARGERPFRSFDEFARRTGLGQGALARLARSDAFGSLKLDRRPALWQALAQEKQLCLFADVEPEEPEVALPPMPLQEQVAADYSTSGLSLRGHPLSFLRPELDRRRVSRARDLATLRPGRYLRVAGLVLVRQRPGTARGITFMTLEDETGVANLIVRPEIWKLYRPAAANAVALLAYGSLERQGPVIHLMTHRLEDLSPLVQQLRSQSRDFH